MTFGALWRKTLLNICVKIYMLFHLNVNQVNSYHSFIGSH